MLRRPLHLALALPVLSLWVAPPASGQLRYTTTTKAEFGGAMGRLMALVPGAGDPTEEVTFLQGSLIRTDGGSSSTIMDWDSGVTTVLDHEARTFTRFDFARMAEGMMAGGGSAARAEPRPTPAEESRPQVEMSFRMEETGRTERVAGYDARQVFLVVEAEPSEEAVAENPEVAGALMAVVTELWLSEDFPEWTFRQEMEGEAMERLRARGAANMEAYAAYDPRVKTAWERNAEELSRLEGTALRTTVHFVSVPPGVELDLEKVLDEADQSLAGDVAAGAADAARKALGGLAGRLRGRQQPREEEAPAPEQAVFLRIVTEIVDVDTGELDESIFQVPEGYTERSMGG